MTAAGVRIERDVPLETRDGTVLRADVYRPAGAGRHPVLLGRTCYGKASWGGWIEPQRTAAEGWVVVIQDTRGGFASEGSFDPFFHDGPDGCDTVEWCAAQEWSDGRVGMFGSSAPGFVQLLAAAERPPHLVAIAPMQTWTSHGRGCVYDPGGALMLFTVQWALLVGMLDPERRWGAGEPGYEERLALARRAHEDPGSWFGAAPLADAEHLPRPWTDYVHRWLSHPDHDAFWEPLDLTRRFAEIGVPALHLVGLFDKFRYGATRNYRALRSRAGAGAGPQRLVIGPWTHGIPVEAKDSAYAFPASASVDVRALVLRWYAHWLRGEDDGLLDEPPVRVWVQGADRWRDAADWPLPEARAVSWHLRSGGRLTVAPPGADEGAHAFASDPNDPVPTVPGALTRSEGPIDVQEIERRDDVLVWTSEPLSEQVEVIGEVVVRLWGSVDARDADWVVTLADVAPDGSSRRVTEGMLRARYRDGQATPAWVAPGAVVEYVIELRPTSNLFRAGRRIRVDVAGTSFPQYAPNPEAAGARQTVMHDAAHPSQIVLPVVPSG